MISVRTLFITLITLSIASFIASLSLGSLNLSLPALLQSLLSHHSYLNHEVILDLRLPRAIAAMVTGGLLALAGCLMQVMLRNPLADPYILGVSGGASVATLGAILIGITGIWLNLSAFIGALCSMYIVFLLGRGAGSWSPVRLLLTGVIIAFAWAAIISLILSLSPNRLLHGMLFWLMGDLSYARLPILGFIILIFGTVISMAWARKLNILAHGNLRALSLGINTNALHRRLYFLIALLTATAVSIAGNIGFIGLIVPHLIRLVIGSDHRYLLPASIILGATLVAIADTVSRTILAPQQLPVGIIIALLGVPIFLYVLSRGYRS